MKFFVEGTKSEKTVFIYLFGAVYDATTNANNSPRC